MKKKPHISVGMEVILLVGSTKPASRLDQHSANPPPIVAKRCKNEIKGTNIVRSSSDKNDASTRVSEASNVNEERISDEEVNENEGDDELRKRVEDFIDKINRSWKAEKLRSTIV
ncbi:hypothetical protein F0562_031342 [Nyssa sinensis]|uniref:Uncharacterized protein n=1 Tax=Nyssa sinensis TaxID=561372 RepID=A0A5J5ARW0_9ASTE|nr:hypothetical protein F0562_031342 [Nyssa sinensis]